MTAVRHGERSHRDYLIRLRAKLEPVAAEGIEIPRLRHWFSFDQHSHNNDGLDKERGEVYKLLKRIDTSCGY